MKEPDSHHLMINEANDMLARLSCGLAIVQSAELQSRLRACADLDGDAPFGVQLPESPAWLTLWPGRPAEVCRTPDPTVAQVSIADSLREGGPLWRDLLLATTQTGAQKQAFELLSAVLDPERSPSAAQMATLLDWAPALDRTAYRYFTRGTGLLGQIRLNLLANGGGSAGSSSHELLEYWGFLHAIADVSMIASEPAASGWLADIAKTFVWRRWTPSFALLRERTMWLAAVAARTAAAFGDGVADDYVVALARADHPIESFDALFGLVTIGLTHERRAGDLTREIERAALFVAHGDLPDDIYLQQMLNTALLVLRDPVEATKRLVATPGFAKAFHPTSEGLMGAALIRSDPVEMSPSGDFIGLLALPRIVGIDGARFYPTDPARLSPLKASAEQVQMVLRRAWQPDSTPTTARLLH